MRISKVIPFKRAQKTGLKWWFSKKFIAAIKHNFTFYRTNELEFLQRRLDTISVYFTERSVSTKFPIIHLKSPEVPKGPEVPKFDKCYLPS